MIILLILLLIISPALCQEPANTNAASLKKSSLAILDFKSENELAEDSKIINSFFKEELLKDSSISIIDIETALMDLALLECFELDCAVQVGEKAGAENVVLGELLKTEENFVLAVQVIRVKEKKLIAKYKVKKPDIDSLKTLLKPLAARIIKKISKKPGIVKPKKIKKIVRKKKIRKKKKKIQVDEERLAKLPKFRHSFIVSSVYKAVGAKQFNYMYNGKMVTNKSIKDNFNLNSFGGSYSFYLTPVYYHKKANLFLDYFYSRPSYLKIKALMVPKLKGTQEAREMNFKSTNNYKADLINFEIALKYYILRSTGIYGAYYMDTSNLEPALVSSSFKADGSGYVFGLTQFIIPTMNCSVYANMYSSDPMVPIDNWADAKSLTKYSSREYLVDLYLITKKKSLSFNMSADNIGLGISYSRKYNNQKEKVTNGMKSNGIEDSIGFLLEQYYMKFIKIGLAYTIKYIDIETSPEKVEDIDYITETTESIYDISFSMYYTDWLHFSLFYNYYSYSSDYYLKSKIENMDSYNIEGSGSKIGLSIGYRL